MKRISILLLVLLFVSVGFNYFENEPVVVKYELVEIPSPSLADALINPRETYKIGVNLPSSYNNSKERYPVIYYLNGFTVYPGQHPLTEVVIGAMKNKSAKEMIVIELTGYNMLKGTLYANSPVTGNWEDFVTIDVINYVDKNYRTIPKRESRGIVGHSMGGGGCTNISLKHSDKYAVAYPMSPSIGEGKDAIVELMFSNDSAMMFLDDISSKMLNVKAKDFQKELLKVIDTSKNNMNWVLGYGMAFAPDLNQPLRMKLPYDRQDDGSYTVNEANYAEWAYGMGRLDLKVEKYKQNLLQYKHYAIDCGQSDHLQFIINGTKYYTSLLSENNIPYSMHWYNGNHSDKVGEQIYSNVLPLMSFYLERE